MKPSVLCLVISCLTCALLIGAAGADSAAAQGFTDAETQGIQAFLDQQFADRADGMVVGLIDENGTRVLGAGRLGDGSGRTVNGDTVFEIGSVTKVFTSLLLLEMRRDGLFMPTDPVANYLPDHVRVPMHEGQSITLEHLAAQEAGMLFNASNHIVAHWVDAYNAYTVEDMYAFLKQHELKTTPGAAFRYSNIGMSLLGHILERRSGHGFDTLVTDRICEPLGMLDTRIGLTSEQKQRRAVGHDAVGDPAPFYQLQVMEAAGAMHSTANDLLRFLSLQLGFTQSPMSLLVEQTHVIRHHDAGHFGRTAMPWYDLGVYQPDGSDFRGHGGTTAGASSFIGFDLGKRRGVVVLTNQVVETTGRHFCHAGNLACAILQGVRLTPSHGSGFLREHVGLGFGLVEAPDADGFRINTVYADSPAEHAGISVGMLLQAVDGVSVQGLSLAEF